ncbi:YceI family protein [Chishuiella changwenlii]|jgi:polyisoprenoid-binding protein YceI|uniref:YceI family protein n=1 Tax=Chishuiella changwenlii TaxID=1434701 RepID=UPI002FD9DB13
MATTWNLDASHSEVQFKVKHMVISTVTGNFDNFSANVEANDDDFSDAKFSFSANVDSINTKNGDRDGHLKSEDFFHADKFPELKFESTSGIKNGKIEGTLEIRGEKKAVSLDADFGGVIQDPFGYTRAGFEFSGEINRKDFGLGWSQVTEAGGLVVSDKVKLSINLEFTKAQ